MKAKTQYARSGDLHIAYQVVGDHPLDIVYVPGWVSHLELAWEEPTMARYLTRLASFSRLIMFDKRGTGLSDRVRDDQLPTLEERMDDLRAVMDAAGSKEAAIMGASEGGNLSALFAASHPERTKALIMYGSYVKRSWSPDYPWAPTPEEREREIEIIEREWGNLMDLEHYVPSKVGDEEFAWRLATYLRRAASPGAAATLLRMNTEIDIRSVLPTISVPTLILNRTGDRDVNVEEARWIAGQIPGARFVELPGDDHFPWVGDQDSVLDEIQEFLTGVRRAPAFDRVLSTVLFTDIVGSTELALRLGDDIWIGLLERHQSLVQTEVARFRGRVIDTAGDGIFATFDGPARAIRCALNIVEGSKSFGIDVRAGVHTGEVELTGSKVGGIAVHIGSRVAAIAEPGEVLVSSTVKDLVAGAGIHFRERGRFELKGIPGERLLFRAV